MRLGCLLLLAALPNLAAAQAAADPDVAIKAFRDICVANRSSFDFQRRAIESSPLDFEIMADAESDEANYLAAPIAASLKRWERGEFSCAVTAVASDGLTTQKFTDLLSKQIPELKSIIFDVSGQEALGEIVIDGKFFGVFVSLPNSPFPMAQVSIRTIP